MNDDLPWLDRAPDDAWQTHPNVAAAMNTMVPEMADGDDSIVLYANLTRTTMVAAMAVAGLEHHFDRPYTIVGDARRCARLGVVALAVGVVALAVGVTGDSCTRVAHELARTAWTPSPARQSATRVRSAGNRTSEPWCARVSLDATTPRCGGSAGRRLVRSGGGSRAQSMGYRVGRGGVNPTASA